MEKIEKLKNGKIEKYYYKVIIFKNDEFLHLFVWNFILDFPISS